jgi:hypothetical protein
MGAVTKIAWCDHTFNPWWGCTQVSPLCDHCYAMMLDARWYKVAHWGPGAPRRYFGGAHWREPLTWQHAAQAEGRRHSVFCASMADVFDNEVDQAMRDRLWSLIRQTAKLDWIVLTKRIGNAPEMLPKGLGRRLSECVAAHIGSIRPVSSGIYRNCSRSPPSCTVSASSPNSRQCISATLRLGCNGSSTAANRVAELGHIISNGRGRSWQNAEHQALRSSSRSSAASHSKAAGRGV